MGHHQSYPLEWPTGWKRTSYRVPSRYQVTLHEAIDDLLEHLRKMRAKNIVLSTNLPTSNKGIPYSAYTEPLDSGAAVYWTDRKNKDFVMACDKWSKVHENMRAVGLTIAAIRGIERAGASELLERAFTGFVALPATAGHSHWTTVLKLDARVLEINEDLIIESYRTLAKLRHPDVPGGSTEAMQELNRAKDEAIRELKLVK